MGLGSLITFDNVSLRNAYGDIWHSSARRYIVGKTFPRVFVRSVVFVVEQHCVRRSECPGSYIYVA